MIKKIKEVLEKIFFLIKDKKRLALIFIILFILGFSFSSYIKPIIFVVFFIAIGSLSKLYHRYIKTTIGIDLILYTTIMTSLVYQNLFFAFIVGWIGLIIADTLALKFSYTSIVSLFGLTSIILISRFFLGINIIVSIILLTLIFEIISVILYYFMGSSPQKIFIFLFSHLLFNLFLIFNFTEFLLIYMI